jgi:hypothetical protein
MALRSRSSSCVWPSGSVIGRPSSSTLISRMPKAARVPKPRIWMRTSCAKSWLLWHEYAGHPVERFLEADGLLRALDVELFDHAQRCRHIGERLGETRRRHHHRLERE